MVRIGASQGAGRFVEHDYSCIDDQGPSNFDELAGRGTQPHYGSLGMNFGVLQQCQSFANSMTMSTTADETPAAFFQSQHHVGFHVEMRSQCQFLIDHGHATEPGILWSARLV